MAATFQFSQSNGAGQTKTDVGDGSGGNYWNFKTNDDATPANYSSNPITAGNDSMEIYVQGHWTGTFNSISNIKFWASANTLTGAGTGNSIKAAVVAVGSYATPSTTPNADSAVPTSQGAGLTLTYGSNFCSYVRLQLHTVNTSPTPGDTGTVTWSMSYDES